MMKIWLACSLILTAAPALLAHSNLIYPPPRNADIKTGPCGGAPKTKSPTIFKSGQEVTVSWEETINHTAEYKFYFAEQNDESNSDKSLKNLIATYTQDKNGGIYSMVITMPLVSCEACTLQMIQWMKDNPNAAPTPYFSCADIALRSDAPATLLSTPGPQLDDSSSDHSSTLTNAVGGCGVLQPRGVNTSIAGLILCFFLSCLALVKIRTRTEG